MAPGAKRPGPKRAPLDMEQLLCAMLLLRGLPSGAGDWQTVANRMPDKLDGSGEKHSGEAVRSMWRRLKAKWEEEGIWSNAQSIKEGEENDNADDKPRKAPKAKAKGKEKEKAKPTKTRKAEVVSDEEDGSDAEARESLEEDSDAGINVVTTKKTLRLAKDDCHEEETDDDEV